MYWLNQMENNRGEAADEQPRKVVHPEDRAEPVELDRHHPIDARQGDGDAEEDEKRRRQAEIFVRPSRVAVLVLPARSLADREREENPDAGVHGSTYQKERP
jgi:hypothetical protein